MQYSKSIVKRRDPCPQRLLLVMLVIQKTPHRDCNFNTILLFMLIFIRNPQAKRVFRVMNFYITFEKLWITLCLYLSFTELRSLGRRRNLGQSPVVRNRTGYESVCIYLYVCTFRVEWSQSQAVRNRIAHSAAFQVQTTDSPKHASEPSLEIWPTLLVLENKSLLVSVEATLLSRAAFSFSLELTKLVGWILTNITSAAVMQAILISI